VRWFVRFDGVEGQKSLATKKLERVAGAGRYLGPFARILLAIVHVREKQPRQALAVLTQLTRDFPQNPLFRSEAQKVASMIGSVR
jgi:predicted Zn-dependent protease